MLLFREPSIFTEIDSQTKSKDSYGIEDILSIRQFLSSNLVKNNESVSGRAQMSEVDAYGIQKIHDILNVPLTLKKPELILLAHPNRIFMKRLYEFYLSDKSVVSNHVLCEKLEKMQKEIDVIVTHNVLPKKQLSGLVKMFNEIYQIWKPTTEGQPSMLVEKKKDKPQITCPNMLYLLAVDGILFKSHNMDSCLRNLSIGISCDSANESNLSPHVAAVSAIREMYNFLAQKPSVAATEIPIIISHVISQLLLKDCTRLREKITVFCNSKNFHLLITPDSPIEPLMAFLASRRALGPDSLWQAKPQIFDVRNAGVVEGNNTPGVEDKKISSKRKHTHESKPSSNKVQRVQTNSETDSDSSDDD